MGGSPKAALLFACAHLQADEDEDEVNLPPAQIIRSGPFQTA